MILTTLLFVVLTGVSQLVAEEIWTSCVVRGHVDGPGNVTCRFGVNLMESKIAFSIQRYGLNPKHKEPDDVLLAAWHDKGQMNYFINPGYVFDERVSNTIVVKMSRITTEYEGRYRCQVIPAVEELVDECVLKMADLHPPLSTDSVTPPTTPIARPTTADQETEDASSAGMNAGAVFPGLIFAAFTAAVTGFR